MIKIVTILTVCIAILGAGCNMATDASSPKKESVSKITKEKLIDETNDGALILYWAEGCTHCERVKFEIQRTGLDKKLNIIAKESYGDDERYREFFARILYCKVPEYQMGVPMLWDGENCFLGVTNIMDELNNKIKKKE